MLEPPSSSKQGVFVDGRFNGAIQIFIGSTLVAMVTKFRPFSTQIGHNLACTNARAKQGVFGDRRLNSTIQIAPGLTLVAMGTKIGLFSQEIGHNSACTNTTAADFAPNMGFSETADLILPFKFSVGRSLLPR